MVLDNYTAELLKRAEQLLISDEERHPVTIDANHDITALAFATHFAVELGNHSAAKTFCETLYVLGYRAGLESAKMKQPDPVIWNF